MERGTKVNVISRNQLQIREKWYRILGHINFKTLNVLCKYNVLHDLPNKISNEFVKCAICMKNKRFENNHQRGRDILEIVHTDVNGPHKTTGYKGERYFLKFLDDYNKPVLS